MDDKEPPFDTIRALWSPVLQSSLKVGAFTGIVGISIGGISGIVQATTPILFSIASGIQCGTLGSTFWAARQTVIIYQARQQQVTIQNISSQQRLKASAIGGGIAGLTTAAIFRGRTNVIPGLMCFSIFGLAGQAAYNAIDASDLPRDDGPGLFERWLNSRYFPVKRISHDDYRSMLNEKLIRVEAEMALIDEEIDRIKALERGQQADTKQ